MSVSLTLPVAAQAADAPAGTVPCKFKYTPSAGATLTSVTVAGDFNGWSTTATPLAEGDDGVHSARVNLTVGRHAYKFVVDSRWANDPAADASLETPDGLGGRNSGVDVKPPPGK